MGLKYQPSSGTEGSCFAEKFCDQCRRDEKNKCGIRTKMLIFDIDHELYPKEICYDGNMKPTCTKFLDQEIYKKIPKKEPKEQLNLWDLY